VDQGAGLTPNYVRDAFELFEGYGADAALVGDGKRFGYADLTGRVRGMANELLAHGVRPGSAVAVLIGNPPEAIFLHFALHLLGCRSVWLAPNAPRRYRVDFLRLAGVDTSVYDARVLPKMGRLMAATDPDLTVLCFGPGGVGPDLTGAPPAESLAIDPSDIVTEPQALFQTGGTTGQPKLVHHGHRYFRAVAALSAQWVAGGGHKLRHLGSTGFWHVSGQQAGMMTLFSGGTLFLDYDFDAGTILATIERERITSTFFTPPIFYEILDHPRLATTDTSSLQMVSVGGSACAQSRLAQAIARLGPVLRPVYGMTEAPFLTALPGLGSDPDHPERLRSCGTAYGDIRIEIRDTDGATLPAGEVGEVWITGALSMDGYWGQPELTRETLVDGWIRTGDMGHLDENGYLFLVDRAKDIIITGLSSTNVYSRPIEDLLAAHPQVRAAAVIGVPDEALGEVVHAYVVPVPGAEVKPEDLCALVANELNEVWAPRTLEFIEALPLTDVGKVDKNALRAQYARRRRVDA
jgi:acyl-CoA synthetase (AMP-forming)/AMP-acid ligase II